MTAEANPVFSLTDYARKLHGCITFTVSIRDLIFCCLSLEVSTVTTISYQYLPFLRVQFRCYLDVRMLTL